MVNIIITSLILITLMVVNDSLLIRLDSSLWDPELIKCMHAGVKKGCSMLRIPVSNWGIVIYSLMMCIFSLNIIILNACIFICANYKLIILLLLSIWFATALTKNFWSKHILKSNPNFFTTFLAYVSDSTKFVPILISLTITIIIVFISRIISRTGVCFLLGDIGSPSIDTLSFSLMILLSWPLLWYIVNIIQKYVKSEKLTIVDFEFCNPYVVEKVNLYGIALNLFINYLADTDLYLLGLFVSIILGFVYIMVKYGDFIFTVYINNHNWLYANTPNWEAILAIGAILVAGLEETDWDVIKAQKIYTHVERQEYKYKGCWNMYTDRRVNDNKPQMGKKCPELALYNKDIPLLRLRSRVYSLLTSNYDFLPFGKYEYNTHFLSDTLTGFSLNTLRTTSTNALVLFIKEKDNDSTRYYPSFFHDLEMKTTNKDLLEKYGIFTNNTERMEYVVLFTQYTKVPFSSLIKVWKPLSYSHMPFTGSRLINYFCYEQPIVVASPLFAPAASVIDRIKKLSLEDWYLDEALLNELKTNMENLTKFYLLTSYQHSGGCLGELGSYPGEVGKHFIGYDYHHSKHSYLHFHDPIWEPWLFFHNNNNPYERVPSYKETVVEHVMRHHLREKIFLAIQDKAYIEPHVLIKEGEGTKLYSIIDSSNPFKWKGSENKPLTLYKDGYNILDSEDNASLIRILAFHFKFQLHAEL